jgi:hypothetical protein
MSFITYREEGAAVVTYEDATAIFQREYARSNGFGTAGLTLGGWSAEDVRRFLLECDQAAKNRGASLKGALVGVTVARKLGMAADIGRGEHFHEIQCFVSVDDDDRLDLFFGPA